MPARDTRDIFFFFNDPATPEIYTLSLHDALPIFAPGNEPRSSGLVASRAAMRAAAPPGDRKSTRLNSSHSQNSYGVFCFEKKKKPLPRGNVSRPWTARAAAGRQSPHA